MTALLKLSSFNFLTNRLPQTHIHSWESKQLSFQIPLLQIHISHEFLRGYSITQVNLKFWIFD